MRVTTLCLCGLLILITATTIGCGDDSESPVVPQLGTITIVLEPTNIEASWRVTGPGGFEQSGTRDTTITDATAGPYTMTWQPLDGWASPNPAASTQNLAANGVLAFTGRFVSELPVTPDELMADFRDAYVSMDVDALTEMLRSDHVTFLQASTTARYPDVGTTLDRVEEVRIHERMFSRQDVIAPGGDLVPGVAAILFQEFQRQGAWVTSLPSDPIPNTESAVFDVLVLFDRGGIYSILKVQGQVKFYVAQRESVVDGVTMFYYEMRGQVDQTLDQKVAENGVKAIENIAWGSVKALFR